jgi:hypothetical protein
LPIALDPSETFEYVLECDRELPEGEQTTFTLRGLTGAERDRIDDMLIVRNADGSQSYRTGSATTSALRFGLKGWGGFRDAKGDEVPFKAIRGTVTDACLDRLTTAWRTELANAITSRGDVSESEGE